jgi:hypothetical protein
MMDNPHEDQSESHRASVGPRAKAGGRINTPDDGPASEAGSARSHDTVKHAATADSIPCPAACDAGQIDCVLRYDLATGVYTYGLRLCPRCDGAGRVPASQLPWIERGAQLRADLKARRSNLSTEAERLRVWPLTLANVLNGQEPESVLISRRGEALITPHDRPAAPAPVPEPKRRTPRRNLHAEGPPVRSTRSGPLLSTS